MRPHLALIVLLASGFFSASTRADGNILIRVSCKVIVNVFDEEPSGFDDSDVETAIAAINEQMDAHGRGYRFVLVDPVIRIGGGASGRPLPSTYFNPEFRLNLIRRDNFETDVLSNPGLYAWNPDAVNIYFNADNLTLCSRPDDRLIALPTLSDASALKQSHALGHFFQICHVAGCSCDCCDTDDTGTCDTVPGDDGMSDTLPNVSCWSADEISQHNFGLPYASLSAGDQDRVDNVYFNIMNNRIQCHGGLVNPLVRLTEKQLDRWADIASGTFRVEVCDGQTFFVDDNAPAFRNGRSGNPFARVAEGLHEANGGGDIVMIRQGSYPEILTISEPVTLRAPRGETARIGG